MPHRDGWFEFAGPLTGIGDRGRRARLGR